MACSVAGLDQAARRAGRLPLGVGNLDHFEAGFRRAAVGADPVVRHVPPACARGQAMLGQTQWPRRRRSRSRGRSSVFRASSIIRTSKGVVKREASACRVTRDSNALLSCVTRHVKRLMLPPTKHSPTGKEARLGRVTERGVVHQPARHGAAACAGRHRVGPRRPRDDVFSPSPGRGDRRFHHAGPRGAAGTEPWRADRARAQPWLPGGSDHPGRTQERVRPARTAGAVRRW